MFNATPFLRLYSQWRRGKLSSLQPAATQEQELLRLVQKAATTKFGKDHGFRSIRSVTDFQRQVPLRRYEQFWEEYLKPVFPVLKDQTWPGTVPYFAVSSGTSSGTTKYIPVTDEMNASNKRAGLDLLVHHLTNCPKSQIFAGRSFILGGSTDLTEQSPGIWSGDLSGIAVKTLPWWAAARYFPPPELALLKNWEEKIEILARGSLEQELRMVSGVPSWMLILFGRLAELRPDLPKRIASWYPNLEMLVHGGVNFAPYYDEFKSLLEGSRAELREVYPASEGFIAVGDRGFGDGLRMVLDHGIFYEFVPVTELDSPTPTRHWIGNIEPDTNYAIVLTTCAGLWSYVIGDTVRFVDTKTPRLLITGRTSYYLSAFGEHLIAEEIEDGVSSAARSIGASIEDYSVGAVFPKKAGELGGHLYVIEFKDPAQARTRLPEFIAALDAQLCKRNEDYEAHRAKGFGLKDPEILIAPPGTFSRWMKKRGKLGGQNKVPRIITKQELFDDLTGFVREVP
jgi:hypothetical protein